MVTRGKYGLMDDDGWVINTEKGSKVADSEMYSFEVNAVHPSANVAVSGAVTARDEDHAIKLFRARLPSTVKK